MEKEKNSQQDLGARSHGEAVSRNESVEKLNEIPGRQICRNLTRWWKSALRSTVTMPV